MTKLLKYARVEHERRFLLARLPDEVTQQAAGFDQLDDLYLAGTRVRLRRVYSPSGEAIERKLTQKLPDPSGAPERRLLTTLYLDAGEYELFARLPGRRLSKRRHRVACAGRPFAIDVFCGPLDGLVLAELEGESAAELAALPPFAHCEVTAEPLFTGGALAEADPAHVLATARRLLGR